MWMRCALSLETSTSNMELLRTFRLLIDVVDANLRCYYGTAMPSVTTLTTYPITVAMRMTVWRSSARTANLFPFFSSISPQHFRCVSNDVTHFCSFFTLVPHSVGPWRLMVVIMRTLDLIYRFFLFKNLNEMKKKEIDLWKQKASKDITAIWFGYVFWSTPLTL